jgi:hypothetical protein
MIRKISIQDVVSKQTNENDSNRHERDYLIERLTRKHLPVSIAESPTRTTKKNPSRRKRTGFKFGKKWIWVGSIFAFILLAFIVLQFLFSATISVTPKQSTVQIDAKLTASIEATMSPNALTYQIITLNASEKETVLATGTVATLPKKASGQITIFNNYSSLPQTLITNTRFETANGLIYRIQNPVKIPGFTISGGKTVPGSITVTVVADQIGSKYNIDTVDFTIPGFKTDTGRYSKIFARSKTAMTLGSDGNSFGVSKEVRQSAQTNIEMRLKESLVKQVQSQKTVDSIVFDNASKISFQYLADTTGVDAQHVVIKEQGTISSVVFDKKTLSKILLEDTINAVGGEAEIKGLEKLHFTATVSTTSPTWQAKQFTFTLTGSVDVIGTFDTNKLLQDIVGIPRSDLSKVLSNYPTINKAVATVKPFWKKMFPTDISKIKIKIVK